MNQPETKLAAGLYLVATPIGTARDITLRALDTLAAADVLAAEDTRSLRRLLGLHGVALGGRGLVSYHDHSNASVRARLVDEISAGRSVAYAAEAGTPLVSDPGHRLVQDVVAAGGQVTAVPGPSALLAALNVAALPADRFMFMGFLPPKSGARRKTLAEVAKVRATLVIYEAPGRVQETLADLVHALGENREAAMCRELTKRFEETRRAPLGVLAAQSVTAPPRGECVLLVGPPVAVEVSDDDLRAALRALVGAQGTRQAAAMVSERFGVPRRRVYALALALSDGPGDDG